MLILNRVANQSVTIHTSDGVIEVMVTEIGADNVRLGFKAPHAVRILRKELLDREPRPRNPPVAGG